MYKQSFLISISLGLVFLFSNNAFAVVSITTATGGSAISADTTGGAFTSLTGPVISESTTADIGIGTIILNVPSGFVFDTGGIAPTVLITRTAGSGADIKNINSASSGASVAITSITTSQITFTVINSTLGGVTNSLTWQNVRVRPSASTPLASGNITKTGTSSIVGVTDSVTNLGTLTEVAGTPTPTPTPTETLTPTPTSTLEPPVIESIPLNSGGSAPTVIVFSGEAYPKALIKIDLLDYVPDFPGATKVLRNLYKMEADRYGHFTINYEEGASGMHLYTLYILEQDNVVSAKFYTYDTKFNTIIRQENIIFPPTFSLDKVLLSKTDTLNISGYGASGNTIQIFKNGTLVSNGKADSNGKYSIKISSDDLSTGTNKIQVRQVDDTTGKTSDLSGIKVVTVGKFAYVSVDLNNDGKVNISDWSIFLSNWSNSNPTIKIKNDLNGDQKVDITDFGIFLTSFKTNL